MLQVMLVATDSRSLGSWMAIVAGVSTAALVLRMWRESRGAALVLLPLAAFLAYRATTLM
jgi:hypothetical protein